MRVIVHVPTGSLASTRIFSNALLDFADQLQRFGFRLECAVINEMPPKEMAPNIYMAIEFRHPGFKKLEADTGLALKIGKSWGEVPTAVLVAHLRRLVGIAIDAARDEDAYPKDLPARFISWAHPGKHEYCDRPSAIVHSRRERIVTLLEWFGVSQREKFPSYIKQ